MPKQFLPPDAKLQTTAAPVHLVNGQVVLGEPGDLRAPWCHLRYQPKNDQGRSHGPVTPVMWDPATGQLWYDPDWQALSLLTYGDKGQCTLGAIEPLMGNGLPLSTCLEGAEYGGGRTLLELMIRNAPWGERWVVKWLENRPDDGFTQDQPDMDANRNVHDDGSRGPVPRSLVTKALNRGWVHVAEILWEKKGIRFTPAECAAGTPFELLADLQWPDGTPPSFEVLARWRQRAVESGTSPNPRGASKLGPPINAMGAVLKAIVHTSPKKSFRHTTSLCRSPEDWVAYLSGWASDLQQAGMTASELSSWAREALADLDSPTKTFRISLQNIDLVRAALQAVALSARLTAHLPRPLGDMRRSPRL